jgi:transglycosylase-like protein with SLT domain
VAGQSITFDFISRGAPALAGDFKRTGDNAAAAARGAKVLQDVIKSLGEKENRTAAESKTLAAALRQTGDAEDRAAAKALAADIAIRRLDDALKDSGKSAGSAKGGLAGLAGEITGFGAASTAASSKSSLFSRALAGVNLASGVLEPALAGVAVAAGGAVAAFASAGIGLGVFGAVAGSVLSQASTAAKAYTTAQKQLNLATTAPQRQAALKAEKAALYGLDAAQKQVVFSVIGAQNAWQGFTRTATPGVAKVLAASVRLLPQAFGLLRPFLAPVEASLTGIIGELKAGTGPGSQFSKIMGDFASHSGKDLTLILQTAGHLFMGVLGVVHAFIPEGGHLLVWADQASAKFAKWGETLSSHTGFQSLMTTFKTETPQAMTILKNLGVVIGNVGKSMFGLSTFSNSKVLLQALLPLSGVLASLSKNQGLSRVVLYLLAATLAAKKLGPAFTGIKAAVAFFPAAAAAITAFAGVTEGATIAETIAAAATRAWGLAMDALPWVALAAAVVVVAVLIIKYHRQIWAFVQRVWHDILAAIMTAWNWVKNNWPLLLGILTGPIGIAAVEIIKHWGAIVAGLKTALGAISSAWNAVWGALRTAFRVFVVDGVLGPLGLIIHGAAAAFGWVPGLGSKLKGAAKAFDTFRADVNSSLGGINGRTVNVSVAMTSSTNPYPGGISGRKAAGGKITGPGGPRADTAGMFALSNGEWVIQSAAASRYGPAAMDAVNQGRAVIGYASGGGVNVAAHTPSSASVESTLMASVTKLAKTFATATGSGFSTPVGNIGSGVGRWAGLVKQVLAMEHLNPFYILDVLYQMQTESGGNPNAINLVDSNAAAGDPSRGLMQTIMSTFLRWHWPGTSFNIYDPEANVAAALNYGAHGRGFGTGPGQIGSGHGYAEGGPVGYAAGGSVPARGAALLKAWRTRHGGGFGAAWGPIPVNPQIDAMTAAQHRAAVLSRAPGLSAAQHRHYTAVAADRKKRVAALVSERGTERSWRTMLGVSDASLTAAIHAAGTAPSLAGNVAGWKTQVARQKATIGNISAMLGLSAAQVTAAQKAGTLGPGGAPLPKVTHTYGGDVTDTIGAFLAAVASPFTGVSMDAGGWLRPGWNPPVYNGTGRPEPVGAARGGGILRLEVASGGSTEFDRFMVGWLRKHVKVKGGTGPGAADRAFAAH